MADWKQITARIRRARGSKDPAGQLANLYEKTQDAMVAFELARHFETTGSTDDAARWYVTAAERFRRADWKTKAREAATRLGAKLPIAEVSNADAAQIVAPQNDEITPKQPIHISHPVTSGANNDNDSEDPAVALGIETSPSASTSGAASAAVNDDKKRRRRGRRGGRRHRKPETSAESAATRQHLAPSTSQTDAAISATAIAQNATSSRSEVLETQMARSAHAKAIPALPVESVAEISGPSSRSSRFGDPGLSSRLSLLEMQFRRLLTCSPAALNQADHAPAGPGVFVLTDSELTSYYYVEACQTLRIAIGNLLRGGASHRGGESIKPQLAEHLGIPESRVTKYLADHCVVRWLQLDEGASHFAHFVISVLRPTLNE